MVKTWIMVAMGGALGALSRYAVSLVFTTHIAGQDFPWPTALVNILGCFLIGLMWQILSGQQPSEWHPLIVIGFLGGFTTFSSFGLETIRLFENGLYTKGLLYVAFSNIAGLVAVVLGVKLAEQFVVN
ncbi:MAG: fluoride efflux transporter CrcB [Bacteroidetes bacterium]|nr:fluoride efflux transporter CrcB [Bacteroidota bacterium]